MVNMTSENETREAVKLTEHIFFYKDDPMKILYLGADGKTGYWLKYIKDVAAKSLLNDSERLILHVHRALMEDVDRDQANVKGGKTAEFDEARMIEEYRKIFATYPAPEGSNAVESPSKPAMPQTKEEALARKNTKEKEEAGRFPAVPAKEMHVTAGSSLMLARELGLPSELADLFFINIDGKPYIKNPGLLYMAAKGRGYQAIQTEDRYNEKSQTWEAVTAIYPKVTADMILAISKLAPEIQKVAMDAITRPTTATGTANKENVQNSRMLKNLREMAQTRSQNRALRPYTGYGGTSAEEMPTGVINAGDE